jgi:periplasmic divalent cation tolerance protein
MQDQKIIVLITVPSMEVGEQIARRLVERRLAACVNILPAIRSIFRWESELQTESEFLLIVKTRAGLFEDHLLPTVQEIHPYKVPEIIGIPLCAGLPSYLEWINQETRQEAWGI